MKDLVIAYCNAYLVQIFEWCQYMLISERSAIKDYEQPPINKVENLDEEVFSLLVDMYKKTVPRYAELCTQNATPYLTCAHIPHAS